MASRPRHRLDAAPEGYDNLAGLLCLRPRQGDPLLVAAARYYFHRAVEEDAKLFQGLAFAKLEALGTAQENGFAALATALTHQGQQVEELLADVQGVVVQTHGAVVDLQQQMVGQSQQLQQLGEAVQELLARHKMQSREVRPGDSLSIRDDTERQLIKQLIARYRCLPEKERQTMPVLLNAIGKLEVVAGDFDAAQRDFQAVADLAPDGPTRAEAHFNAFQAALERRDLGGAMKEFLTAVELNGSRYAPFPVGTYNPIRILGAGGFGTAFLCRHRYMNADVVVKVFRMDGLGRDADAVFTEAQVLRQLDHPAIIRITECGYADTARKSRPFLIMDYFEGETLEERVRTVGPMTVPDLLEVGRQVAEGLQAAHGAKILHRDVKPANLLVRREGLRWKVKIIDFGLAVTQAAAKQSLSGGVARARQTLLRASIAGTLEYAAPEQMGRRDEPVGPYSDVYGWAKTCCFALFQTTQPLRSHWNSLPEGLAELFEKCLTEDPWQRPMDMAEVIKTLTGLNGPALDTNARKTPQRGEKAEVATVGIDAGATYRVLVEREKHDRRERVRPEQEWREPERPERELPEAEAIPRRRRTIRRDGEHKSRHGSWRVIVRQIPVWGWLVAGWGLLAVLGGLMQIALAMGGKRAPSPFGPPIEARQTEKQFEPVPAEELRPAADDLESARVYLSDLQEFDLGTFPIGWRFGKNGELGHPFVKNITAHSQRYKKALCTQPTASSYNRVKYRIAPAELFQTFVGIDDCSEGVKSDVTFEVWGDGKRLWTSSAVRRTKAFQACRVGVQSVKILELRAYASGSEFGTHAVWIDPYIVRKSLDGRSDRGPDGPPAKSDSAKPAEKESVPTPPKELLAPADDPVSARVYLSDLQEFDLKAGAWQFGKNGNQGDPFNNQTTAHGHKFAKALSTHPSSNDYTGVKYNIESAETLQTFVGIADSSGGAWSDVTFEVWGDGKQLWKSKAVRKPKQFQTCRISVRGVKVLEVRAYASGFAHHCHAVWIDPYIVRPKK